MFFLIIFISLSLAFILNFSNKEFVQLTLVLLFIYGIFEFGAFLNGTSLPEKTKIEITQ